MPKIYISERGEIKFEKETLDAVNIKAGDDVVIQETEEGIVIFKKEMEQ